MSEKIDRRTWLKIIGGTITGFVIGAVVGWFGKPIKEVVRTETITSTITKTVTAPLSTTPPPALTTPAVKEVKVGVVLPLSGPVAKEGSLARHGIELAIDHINRFGGVKSLGGAKLKPIWADSRGKPEVGMAEAERLITIEKVHVLTGCYQSAVTLPVASVAEKHGIPFMVADAISDAITEQGYKWVFRVHGKASWYGKSLVNFIKDTNEKFGTDFKTIGLVYENSEFGKSSANGFKRYLSELAPNYKIVIDEDYPATAADLTPLVTKIKAADPELLVHTGYVSDCILFMKTLKTLEWYPKAYMGLGAAGQAYPDYIKGLGKDSEFVFTETEWQPDLLNSPKLKEMKWVNDEYKSRYGEDMVGTPADCYTSTWVLYYGIEKAGSLEPEKIREALHSLVLEPPLRGLLLPYKIDLTRPDNQNPYALIPVAQIREGKFRIVWPFDYATIEPIWPVPTWKER